MKDNPRTPLWGREKKKKKNRKKRTEIGQLLYFSALSFSFVISQEESPHSGHDGGQFPPN